jgi:hypothetical protein
VILLAAVIGVVLIVEPFGDEEASGEPAPTPLEAKAEGIEARLEERPDDAKLLRAGLLAWLDAANDRISSSRLKGVPIPYPALARDYATALGFWPSYLRQTGGRAGAELAESMANVYMRLAEIGSHYPARIEANIAGAVRAIGIASRLSHSLHILSNAAIFAYYKGEFDRGERMARTTLTTVPPNSRPLVRQQFAEYRSNARVFLRLLREARQELRETGRARLTEPLRVYRTSSELNEDDPAQKGPS